MQYYKHADSYSLNCNIVHDTKHHNRKLRKVTIITVTSYKYNNITKSKLKNEPHNKKKLFTDACYISST